MGISQYSVYITSYFHHQKIDMDMQYGNLIMPIFMVSNSIFAPLAGFIEKNRIILYFNIKFFFVRIRHIFIYESNKYIEISFINYFFRI